MDPISNLEKQIEALHVTMLGQVVNKDKLSHSKSPRAVGKIRETSPYPGSFSNRRPTDTEPAQKSKMTMDQLKTLEDRNRAVSPIKNSRTSPARQILQNYRDQINEDSFQNHNGTNHGSIIEELNMMRSTTEPSSRLDTSQTQ